LRVNRLRDLCVHNLVGVGTTLDADPLVGMIFREVCSRHKVVLYVLRGESPGCEQQ